MDKGEDILKLWDEYDKTLSIDVKNKLILNYLDLVKRVVARMMPNYSSYCDYDDLISVGIFGLMESIERFDLSKNVKFETFATKRIRGKVIDFLREQDWAPVSLRKKLKDVSKAYAELEMKYGRSVSEEEVAAHLGMDIDKFYEILNKSYMFNIVYFESVVETDDYDGVALKNILPGEAGDPAFEHIEKRELYDILTKFINELPENERRVIELYYYEGLLLRQISEIMNVSESRVSQIHSKVILKLRARLDKIYSK